MARIRIDTALRAADPAVLIMAGVPSATARDPVVEIEVRTVPPHFIEPWATVEVIRDATDGSKSVPLRPEAALEILRGSVVRTSGVIHLLASPTDSNCQGMSLRCRRGADGATAVGAAANPKAAVEDGLRAAAAQSDTERTVIVDMNSGPCRASRRVTKHSDDGRTRGGRGDAEDKRCGRTSRSDEGVGQAGPDRNYRGRGARTRDRGGNLRELDSDNDGRHKGSERPRRHGVDGVRGGRERRDEKAGCGEEIAPTPIVATAEEGHGVGDRTLDGGNRGKGCEEWATEAGRDWASRLYDWGVVTESTKVMVPSSAIEVWYHDTEHTADGDPTVEEKGACLKGSRRGVWRQPVSHGVAVCMMIHNRLNLAVML